jgi:hypothetical protein
LLHLIYKFLIFDQKRKQHAVGFGGWFFERERGYFRKAATSFGGEI